MGVVLGVGIGPYAGMVLGAVPHVGVKPLSVRGLSPKFLRKSFYTPKANMLLGDKMAENKQTGAGSTPEAGEFFVNEPARGMFVRAKFDERGRLTWAYAKDEPHEIEVRIKQDMGDVVVALKWRDFELRLKAGFGINLPYMFYESAFTKVYRLPIEYFKALLMLVEDVIEKKYESAQSLFEEIYEELGE